MPVSDPALALGARPGLPEDLLFLLRAHPRAGWDGSLGALGRFWLSRHALFRDVHAALETETRALAADGADPKAVAPRFGRLAGFLLSELDGHHRIEDDHYFPRLARLEPRLQRGFDLLDADHHALHETLDGAAAAARALLSALRRGPARAESETAAEAVGGLGRLLDRHLADEEDIVAPLLIARGEELLG